MKNQDKPIVSINEDELDYCHFAYYLAKAIYNITSTDTSYAIGIVGKWGDGKTSAFNLTKQYFRFFEKNKNDNLDILDVNEKIRQDNNLTSNKKIHYQQKCKYISTVITALMFICFVMWLICIFFNKFLVFLKDHFIYSTTMLLLGFVFVITCLVYYYKNIISFFKKTFKFPEPIDSESIPIIEFSAWDFSTNIEKDFFKQLTQKLYKTESNCLKEIACMISLYSSSAFKKEFLSEIFFDNNSKTDIKEEIKQFLENECNNKKIIILIDNIDRLLPKEIMSIFKLVRSMADFPNFIYVLCYDKKQIVSLLNEKFKIDADEFIKKIVQTEQYLPLIPKENLKNLFIKKMKKIITDETYSSYENDIDVLIDEAILNNYIKNIRDLKIFFTAFEYDYSIYKNENLNIYDLIGICTIKTFCSELYLYIKNNKNKFISLDFEKIQTEQPVINNIDIINLLFPITRLETASNDGITQQDMLKKLTRIRTLSDTKNNYRRIYNKLFFDNYFKTNLNKENITYPERQSLLNNLNNKNTFNKNFYEIAQKDKQKIKDFIIYWDTSYNDTLNTEQNNLLFLNNLLAMDVKNAEFGNFLNEIIPDVINQIEKKCEIEKILTLIKNNLSNIKNQPYLFIYTIFHTAYVPVNNPPKLNDDKKAILDEIINTIDKKDVLTIENLNNCSKAFSCLYYLSKNLKTNNLLNSLLDELLLEKNVKMMLKLAIDTNNSYYNCEDFINLFEKKEKNLKAILISLYKNDSIMSNPDYFIIENYEKIHIVKKLLSVILKLTNLTHNEYMMLFFNNDLKQDIEKWNLAIKCIEEFFETHTDEEIEILSEILESENYPDYKQKYNEIINTNEVFISNNLQEHQNTLKKFKNFIKIQTQPR